MTQFSSVGVTIDDAKCMSLIIEQDEKLSENKVNYDKSSVIFGMKINHHIRTQIDLILKITKDDGGGKYLDLPEQFGRSKVSEFQSIVVDKVQDQTIP